MNSHTHSKAQAVKRLLLFSLIFVSFGGFAQNWQTINSTREAYFVEQSRNMHAIHPDSSRLIGMDSVFYHFRSPQHNFSTTCGNPLSPSWAGLKTLISPSGRNVFFNDNGDSIFIYTQNRTSTWRMYTYPNGDYLQAGVLSTGVANVLNIPDSILILDITAYNSSSSPVADIFNNKQIILSKNFGLTQVYNMASFPQDTTTYRLIPGHRLTYGEVFDFQVGDVFETLVLGTSGPGPIDVEKITGKTLWTDSVQYNYADTFYTRTFIGNPCCSTTSSASVTNGTVTYKNLSAFIGGSYFPEQTIFYPSPGDTTGVIWYTMMNGNGSCQPVSETYSAGGYNYSANCMQISFDPIGTSYTYTVGRGALLNAMIDNPMYQTMPYCLKGSLVCGTWSQTPAGITDHGAIDAQSLSLFPNPASTRLTLTWKPVNISGKLEMELFDMLGSRSVQILQPDASAGTEQFDVSSLPAGIYCIRIHTGTDSVSKLFVKE